MLTLRSSATSQIVVKDGLMKKYMRANVKSWHRFSVSNECGMDCEQDDLLFVRGWTKTKKWHLAAFWRGSKTLSGSVRGQITPAGSVELNVSMDDKATMEKEERSNLQDTQHAPQFDEDPGDCVFLRAFRTKKRRVPLFKSPPKIKAAAGYHKLPGPDNDHYSPGYAMQVDCEGSSDIEIESHSAPLTVSSLQHIPAALPII